MKLSDYVARFLVEEGIRHIFAISGGASIHLIDSIEKTPGIGFVCPQHEQAGAMAADAYARVTGNLGAALATSGPGATNMLTGVCCAFYDSIPVLFLTGNVATFRMRGTTGVRQLGFQETDTLGIYRPVTKYAVQIVDPSRIRFELEKAAHIARSDRPGPVLVDIPDDVQRMEIDPEHLDSYVPPTSPRDPNRLRALIDRCLPLLGAASRPVVVLGVGVRLAKAEEEARRFVERLGFPLVPSWAMLDLFPSDHPLFVGSFGTHGTRHGNFAVQNADLLLSIGCRLDTHETGSPITTFAREARKIVVDVDPTELGKFQALGMKVDVLVESDAGEFLREAAARLKDFTPPEIGPWKARISDWKARYPVCPAHYRAEREANPYVFVEALSRAARTDDIFVVDTGCIIAWMTQGFAFRGRQRMLHDFNNTAMGYALPAAIGACFAQEGRPVVCVTGDGALQMNIQELATVIRHRLPVKIFLINNHGFSMIQQTQDQWLQSNYLASSVAGGLAAPDFVRVAEAYGFPASTISENRGMEEEIRRVLAADGPQFCNVEIRPEHRVLPQVKYGRPIEDAEPLLDRAEFLANMIVRPLDGSRT